MSLKTFHILFIIMSSALAFGFCGWSLNNYYSSQGTIGDLLTGIGSLLAGIGLIIYGRYFLKKLKDVGYL